MPEAGLGILIRDGEIIFELPVGSEHIEIPLDDQLKISEGSCHTSLVRWRTEKE